MTTSPPGSPRFQDRVALVTGAARGIGAASAERLLAEGARVWLVDRDADELERTVSSLATDRAAAVPGDVADPELWPGLADRIAAENGRLDVLHCNAYTVTVAPLHEQTPADWERQLAVNLTSVFLALRSLVGLLRSSRGAVVLSSSVHARRGVPGHPAYAASKGAMLSLVQQLAVEYGPAIRVNAVVPGPILTAAWDRVAAPDRERSIRQTTLGRFGRPDEVAAAVAFLASDDASYVTGTSLTVDGGWSVAVDSS